MFQLPKDARFIEPLDEVSLLILFGLRELLGNVDVSVVVAVDVVDQRTVDRLRQEVAVSQRD